MNTQDAPWPRTNKNMNATSSSNLWERVRAKKTFLKMDIHKNVANQKFPILVRNTLIQLIMIPTNILLAGVK